MPPDIIVWILIGVAFWTLIAFGGGLLVGRAIRMRDLRKDGEAGGEWGDPRLAAEMIERPEGDR